MSRCLNGTGTVSKTVKSFKAMCEFEPHSRRQYVRLSLTGKAEVLKISSNCVSDVPVRVRGRTPICRSRSAGGALAWKASSPL